LSWLGYGSKITQLFGIVLAKERGIILERARSWKSLDLMACTLRWDKIVREMGQLLFVSTLTRKPRVFAFAFPSSRNFEIQGVCK
jgi:hypothetical protein